ncbi:MAG: TonB-dependent receptor [Chitinophagaceae bacterium]|nr:TonB-dependent receptor [Chitinophagaceae bacterium]
MRTSLNRLTALRWAKSSCCLLFLFTLYSFPAFSQHGAIRGSMIDSKTMAPLEGATIVVEGTNGVAIADSGGNFIILNITPGVYRVTGSNLSYESFTKDGVVIAAGDTTQLEITLQPLGVSLDEIQIVARRNRESETTLLAEQRNSLLAVQNVGASELSRKGIGDALTAVAKVSGISNQEGVKNVFVRGLGDRYNVTLLNGMPIPSEDPEYKNIALSFFGTDIIQSIGVHKVFSAETSGDVGGAVINISSKELYNNSQLELEISQGVNLQANKNNFYRPGGTDLLGFANTKQPVSGKFDFSNSLDPSVVNLPIDQSYRIWGGKRFEAGKNPLSLFGVLTHSTDYSFTEEIVRNMTTNGTIYQDQKGKRYSQKMNQLALINANYKINGLHSVAYNFMVLHATNQYVGEYIGMHSEKHQDGYNYMGYLRRQQINDNRLFTHQLLTNWKLSEKWALTADASLNTLKGLEPDRRENYLSMKTDGSYGLTGSNRQKRFFSDLNANEYNGRLMFDYKLSDGGSDNSKISFGYNVHISDNAFKSTEYNFSAVPGQSFSLNHIVLDDVYNTSNFEKGMFSLAQGFANKYNVTTKIHAGFAESSYQITEALSGNIGFRLDFVDMKVVYDVPGRLDQNSIKNPFYLPSVNLRYEFDSKNALRLGASKTYTLPQSKEISPYQYADIGFASEGNPNIKPSDNYNIDLKWDNYPGRSELLSVGVFYKQIKNPIDRVDKGNSAGLLTYDNIGDMASVAGIELEVRKNLVNNENAAHSGSNKFSVGFNASYIHTSVLLKLANTPERKSGLEGASPFLANADITHYYSNNKRSLTSSLVFSYFSDRIYTNGTVGYGDIMEQGAGTLDFVSSFKFSRNLSLKFRAGNLLDPYYRLTRKPTGSNENIVLNEFRKGVNLSIGARFNL